MKNRHMLLLALFALAMIVWCLALTGCETQNPICSDNFCVVGEVFPRSELDNPHFSEVDVDDSVIFATLVGTTTPIENPSVEVNPEAQNPTRPTQQNTLEDANQTTIGAIVSNTLSGGNRFEGTVVEITAVVRIVDDENEWLTLQTNNANVSFFVNAYGDLLEGTLKKTFVEGKSYTFQLYIQEQEPPDGQFDHHAIWTYPVEDIIDTNLRSIVSNTLAGNKRFEGKVVNITATANYVSVSNAAMTLETNDTSIRFWVYVFGDRLNDKFPKTFIKGNSYNLQLYIQEQESDAIKSIRSYLVKVN